MAVPQNLIFNKYIMRHGRPSDADNLTVPGVINCLHIAEFLASLRCDKATEAAFPVLGDIHTTDVGRAYKSGAVVKMGYELFTNKIPTITSHKGGITNKPTDAVLGHKDTTKATLAVTHEPILNSWCNAINYPGYPGDIGNAAAWSEGDFVALDSAAAHGFRLKYQAPVKIPDFAGVCIALRAKGIKDAMDIADFIMNDAQSIRALFGRAQESFMLIPASFECNFGR
jgi:hypothetical protein